MTCPLFSSFAAGVVTVCTRDNLVPVGYSEQGSRGTGESTSNTTETHSRTGTLDECCVVERAGGSPRRPTGALNSTLFLLQAVGLIILQAQSNPIRCSYLVYAKYEPFYVTEQTTVGTSLLNFVRPRRCWASGYLG